ncbi:imidazoleglycerol-phosphate dehydratase HisB [Endomicrobium proavitum]|uniref:Imidazoleglycerol-phosphate dehydratase n=1 Tax=Endomicrobium proavitum TaxID=1408281 RepID=A0A0G3WJW8_9BACT|nr:imidazoleglycerol-phosphate dehydratase HisB [Endomicrobium proavitum]AKL97799.1 Imidazoleglycerol-phosphate dehydratase [Endomicrobium proavitum]
MKQRKANVKRVTKETNVLVELNLDKSSKPEISTSIGFLDHMLELFGAHSGFTLKVKASGDTHIDDHHLVEDTGITLGLALKEALGDKKAIARYGHFLLPMDEALSYVALDLSGRFFFSYEAQIEFQKTGFNYDLIHEFFYALASSAGITLHIKMIKGRNNHHIAEAMFKAFAKALAQAAARTKGKKIPSTKGIL